MSGGAVAIVLYPNDLPKPLQADFSMSWSPNLLRESEGSGYLAQRLLTYGNTQTLSTAIILNTVEEYQSWLDFVRRLNDGCDWFRIILFQNEYRARLQSGKWSETLICRTETVVMRKISFTLDLEFVD